jgi:hypothetical protein
MVNSVGVGNIGPHHISSQSDSLCQDGPELSSKLYKSRPHSSSLFTGRRKYLDEMKEYFFTHQESEAEFGLGLKSFLLYGMAGIGKTQICLRFAEENNNG